MIRSIVAGTLAAQEIDLLGGDDNGHLHHRFRRSGFADGGNANGLLTELNVLGEAGTANKLFIDDTGDATADTLTITPLQLGAGSGDNFSSAPAGA